MMKFDLHMHTRRYSPDSEMDPFELVQRALEIGLDGIVITEHDRLWPEDELDELREAAPGLVVLGGVEVSGRNGDLLCYGVSDLSSLPRGGRWGVLCREAARRDGITVAAHPFRWGQDFERLLQEEQPNLGGLDMMSSNMDETLRRRVAQFHAQNLALSVSIWMHLPS